ncbi:MAG TPA: hypothetical protein DHN33_09490, partial [Eubacteriaceae bacterium]|nr:hypothetical protein [Eubacteriaceae bacterium]
MNFFDQYFTSGFLTGLQNFIVAIIVLLVGWLIVKMIAGAVEKALQKIDLDEKLFSKFQTGEKKVDTNHVIGRVVYYILLVILFIIFFNLLNLNMIATPLSSLITTLFNFIPAVLKALLILLFAFVLATVLQWLIVKAGKKLNLQKLFSKLPLSADEENTQSAIETVGKVVFYVVMLLFIPGVLDALNIQGVSAPFTELLATILSFIPRLMAAALIFVIGWVVAKIIKGILINLLKAVGSENLVDKLKLNNLFENTSLASFVGNLVFVLLMIPITIAALEKLSLTGITDPAISMLNDIMNMLPNVLVAAVLILVGIWLGKLIGQFVADLLQRLGFDGLASKIQLGDFEASEAKMKPSEIVGYIVHVLIVFFLAVQALNLIRFEFLVNIAAGITAYLPNVIAAILILFVALIVAGIVEKVLVNLLHGPAIKILAGFAKYAIIVLAMFMALSQLGIATSIVNAAFVLILGGLTIAFGLAFGLGGKDFAAKYLKKFDQ